MAKLIKFATPENFQAPAFYGSLEAAFRCKFATFSSPPLLFPVDQITNFSRFVTCRLSLPTLLLQWP